MARVAVIGEPWLIREYGLTGAMSCPATDQAEAVLAWRDLPEQIEVAVLTPSAARWLATEIARRPAVLPVLLAEVPPASKMPGRHDEPGLLGEPTEPQLPPERGGDVP